MSFKDDFNRNANSFMFADGRTKKAKSAQRAQQELLANATDEDLQEFAGESTKLLNFLKMIREEIKNKLIKTTES